MIAPRRLRPEARGSRGFTLIELMVGLVIGLISCIVIAQVLATSEGRRRTNVSGSEAQVVAAMAMYTVQRDVQMSGYGLTAATSGLGCPIVAKFNGTSFSFTLAPLLITQGANGAPDTIMLMSSAKLSYSVPARVVTDHPRTAANFFVNSTIGMATGDLMIAVPPTIDANNWCSIFNITNLPGNTQVIHNAGSGGDWNQPGGQTIFPNAGYPAGSYLIDLGQFATTTYSVGPQATLQQATFSTTTGTSTTVDLYPDIVNLKALYAKDSDGDGVVDTYDAAQPADAAAWQKVKGVRLAIVARSPKMERDDVTVANPSWDVGTTGTVAGATACGASMCLPLKVDALTDWKKYRYKVYDTFVPLRNLLWKT